MTVNLPVVNSDKHDIDNISSDLSQLIDGDILSKEWERSIYSTDASPYEIMPLCVVLPKSNEDVIKTVKYASEHRIPIIARGGGSGLAGQAIGAGIIIDFSKYMNEIKEINTENNYVIVQPGIFKSVLDQKLKKQNKFLPPDPSSSDMCTAGGMIANNSCGAHTVKYGSTIDFVESLLIVLHNGDVIRTKPFDVKSNDWNKLLETKNLESELYSKIVNLVDNNYDLIIKKTPKVTKNSSGYRLEQVLKNNIFDASKLFVSSEGTLGIVLEIKFRIVDIPKYKNLALLQFDDLTKAGKAVMHILKIGPSALEIIDAKILKMAQASYPELTQFPKNLQAVLLVEFDHSTKDGVDKQMQSLKLKFKKINNLAIDLETFSNPVDMKKIWSLRKKSLLFTYKVRIDNKRPQSFVEDIVVTPNKLATFITNLNKIYKKYGVDAMVYGHAGDGHLHSRPLLDLTDPTDNQKMITLADEIFKLTTKLGGSITGEHGDGLSRSEYIKSVYGNEVYDLFREVKNIFDPLNILNPGKKITDDHGVINTNLRLGLDYKRRNIQTHLNWKIKDNNLIKKITGYNEELSYENEVELCHGCGACRETVYTGRMCPVYKAQNGEIDSCRGRNNLLRWMIKTTGLNTDFEYDDDYGDAIFKHCIQCKMCHVDCSSNVNVAKLMAEARARYVDVKGLPKGYKYFMNLDHYADLGVKLFPISNLLIKFKPFRLIMEWLTGIDKNRNFPPFTKTLFSDIIKSSPPTSNIQLDKKIVLFYDTYINYNNPQLGLNIMKMFEKNGFQTIIPPQQSSGLPALVEGDPKLGKKIAEYNIEHLAPYASQGIPIVCFSPSAGISLKMEYLNVIDNENSRLIADNTYDLHEFLYKLFKNNELNMNFKTINENVGIHLHCHHLVQKVESDVLNLLKLIPGLQVQLVENGCCGVGGSYSFIKNNFDLSLKMGEGLFDTIKTLNQKIYTTGESCMLQLEYGTNQNIGLTTDLLFNAYSLNENSD